jgi:DNA-binding transcriptional regulator LsrR (DeoR family)
MGIMENDRLTIKICKLFYEENLSQKEIALKLSVSRPQISRTLARARQEGWVTVHIHNPYAEEDALEQELAGRYGLGQALVINTRSGGETEKIIGRNAAAQTAAYVANHKVIGIMSGKAVFHALDNAVLARNADRVFVSLEGSAGVAGTYWHANYIAQFMAEKTGGKAYLLNAPLLVQNKNTKKTLAEEDEIRRVFGFFKECEVIFTGIDQIDAGAAVAESGILTGNDITFLKENGAIAVTGGIFFDERGNHLVNPLTRRFISIGYDDLRSCPKVVAVAFGTEKVPAVDAVLRGGFVHELITSSETAEALLVYPKRAEPF